MSENKNKKYINNILEFVCSNLKINKPRIEFTSDKNKIGSNIALTIISSNINQNNTIIVKEFIEIDYDIIFSIVHELRHIYQYYYDKQILENYKSNKEIKNVEEYNLQEAEIDANAYATRFMIDNFNVLPKFEGLSQKVKEKIYKKSMEFD